jgi:4-hydroxythreonine-4-phosphate dehydrogenase
VSSEQPIVIAAGDPAGVGPHVSVRAAYAARERIACVIFGDGEQLQREARAAGFELSELRESDEQALAVPSGAVGFVDTGRVPAAIIDLHAPSAEAGQAQLATLARAATAVRAGRGRALVTGPTSKAAIVSAGQPFTGQTEYLAQLDGRADDEVTMLFLGPKLRVGLVTTHLALAEVPRAITAARVVRTVRHLAEALSRLSVQPLRSLLVAGLNPHAGEEGLFGSEELEVLAPALALLAREEPFASGAVALLGPSPAEAVFRAAQRGDVDGVVAMFHDQATIASKLLDWGAAVNTTWGLSFVRTSVDHGVAYDAARARSVDAGGMVAALELAHRLTAVGHG